MLGCPFIYAERKNNQLNRRDFMQTSAALLSTAALPHDTFAVGKNFAQHLVGKIVSAPDVRADAS
jgi:hypothetical protein